MAKKLPSWEERKQETLQMLIHLENQLCDIKNKLVENNDFSRAEGEALDVIYDPPESLNRRFYELLDEIDADIHGVEKKRDAIIKIYELYDLAVKPASWNHSIFL